jgi:hypothetical protein
MSSRPSTIPTREGLAGSLVPNGELLSGELKKDASFDLFFGLMNDEPHRRFVLVALASWDLAETGEHISWDAMVTLAGGKSPQVKDGLEAAQRSLVTMAEAQWRASRR